jgi:two-component system, OmpR family, response regulator VicR
MVMVAESSTNSQKQKQQQIMVIYNNLDQHEPLNDSLTTDGYDVIIAVDENEALDILGKITPDMVILDTVTADAHSLHILDSVKHKSDVPVMIITPDIEMDTLKEMFEHGADDIVYRPLNMHSLMARVHAIMRRWYHFHRVLITKGKRLPRHSLS